MHGRVALLIAVVMLALVAGTSSDAGSSTGLHGVVTRSPTRPVCVEGAACREPAAGVVLVFRRHGATIARARTTASGAYRVALRRGPYDVSVQGSRPVPRISPKAARVIAGRMTRLDFEIDTGLQ